MAASYFYSIKFEFIANNEEELISKTFENKNLFISRSEAFEYGSSLFHQHEDQFIDVEHLIQTILTISFNISKPEKEFDSGFVIDYKSSQELQLYKIRYQKLEEIGDNIMKEIEILRSLANHNNQQIIDFGRHIAITTGELEFADYVRQKILNIDPSKSQSYNSKFQILNCTRCDKQMEVENKISTLFNEKKNRGAKISLVCNRCIETYYSNPQYNFYLQEIYNKSGKSIKNVKRDLY